MMQSEHINELITALAKAQAEIQPAIKDSVNPFFKSKYADLSSVWKACNEPLTKNGLAVIQTTDQRDGQLVLVTTLAHASGQWIRSVLPIVSAKQDAQGIGSAITYMRRYSLAAIVGVTTDEDDDGNAASQAPAQKNITPQVITRDEASELEEMLLECDDDFASNVRGYLKSLGLSSFTQLPRANYQSVRRRIVNKVAESESVVTHG